MSKPSEWDANQPRISRVCTVAATMLKMDSPVEFVDAAIEMAFRIEAKVKQVIDEGR